MKTSLSKITILVFMLNSLIIAVAGIASHWHYIDFNDALWTKSLYNICLGELICSLFGIYESQDWLTIASSAILLILALRSLKYEKDHANRKGAFCILLVMYEVTKLLLCIVYSGEGSVVQF